MASEQLLRVCLLFTMLLIIGALVCVPLFDWSFKKFFSSKLWVKVYWWIPIFVIFLLVIQFGFPVAAAVSLVLLAGIWRDYRPFHRKASWFPAGYAILVALCLALLPLYFLKDSPATIQRLVLVGFASPLSDVFAFFLGNYAGRHPLPAFINRRKYWEGVAGQVIGALVGVWLLTLFVGLPATWLLGLAIGLASAIGDILNSIAKRQLGIKDWSHAIPGHGGILDRCSSLSLALLVGYLSLFI